jgi:hypothetical protein
MRVIVFRSSTTNTGSTESTKINHPLQAALPAVAGNNPHAHRQKRRASPAPVIYLIRSEIKRPAQAGWRINLFYTALRTVRF